MAVNSSVQDIPLAAITTWMEQSRSESVDWHRSSTGQLGPEDPRLSAYCAGFEQGWRQAILSLQFHGFVRVPGTK